MITQLEFQSIVHETKPVVLSAIEKYLYERFFDAVDDVAQETYIRAYKALAKGSFREDSKISTWLYTIAKNESIRMNQKLEREEKKMSKLKENQIENNSSDEPSKIDFGYVKKLLNLVPEIYRNVVELYLEGKSEKQIANTLMVKQGTVKSRMFRAKKIVNELKGKENA